MKKKLTKLEHYEAQGLLALLAQYRVQLHAETNGDAMVMLQLMIDEVTAEIRKRNMAILDERAAERGLS